MLWDFVSCLCARSIVGGLGITWRSKGSHSHVEIAASSVKGKLWKTLEGIGCIFMWRLEIGYGVSTSFAVFSHSCGHFAQVCIFQNV